MMFLENFKELLIREPRHYAPRQECENSDYSSFCYRAKDCYMCFACDFIQDCFHLYHSQNNKDCMDGMSDWESELSYECMDTLRFYNCDFCWNGANNRDCFLCEDIRGCKNCFGCSGLRQAEYCIFNKKYSHDEYVTKVLELKKEFFENGEWFENEKGEVNKVMQQFDEVRFLVPHCYMQVLRCENFVGDYSENSKNIYWGFDLQNCEDCEYVWGCFGTKDSADCFYVHSGQLCYDCMSIGGGGFNVDSSFWMVGCRDCTAGYCCHHCEHCFGCINLKHKKFCILNKQYSESEYFKRRDEIIAELRKEGIYGENLIYLAMKDVELGSEARSLVG